MNYLSGRDIFQSERIYIARYSNIGGLEPSTDITLNGFKVGYVREIYFAEDHSGNLIIKLAITKDFDLPVGTKAEIVSSDLLGSKEVQLTLAETDVFYEKYDTLLTGIEADIKSQVSGQLAPLKAKAEKLLSSLDSAVTTITMVFNEETRKNLTESFANINYLSKDLKILIQTEKEDIAALISNLRSVSDNLNNNSDKLDHIFSNISEFSDSLASIELKSSINKIDKAINNLEQITAKIEAGEGTMGKLINDPLLYQNINSTTENLNRLLIDLRHNPKRYIHMSVFDLGKEIYLTPGPNASSESKYSYKVLLMTSDMAIPLSSPIFENINSVEESKSRSKYNYLTGNEKSISEARIILNRIQNAFPDATILAFKNGKKIKLEKALKATSK
jgi:phospholipid/cholesterol/gamma-HCH transport system substrate-binding protein